MYVVESVEPEFSNPGIYMCLSNQCQVICYMYRECGPRALSLKSCDLSYLSNQCQVTVNYEVTDQWMTQLYSTTTNVVQLHHLQVHCNSGLSCLVYFIKLDDWWMIRLTCSTCIRDITMTVDDWLAINPRKICKTSPCSKTFPHQCKKNKNGQLKVYMETWRTFNRYFKKDPEPTTNDMLVVQLLNIIYLYKYLFFNELQVKLYLSTQSFA